MTDNIDSKDPLFDEDAEAQVESLIEDSDSTAEPVEEPEAAPEPITSFSQILSDPALLETMDRLGFITPTPVQAQTIPAALKGRDCLVQAQTGSGKTLAFALPLISHLKTACAEAPVEYTYGLIVTPTRELAVQIRDVLNSVADWVRSVCVIGGANSESQLAELRKDPRIIVGTPGRILDFIRQKAIKLNRCRYFVLDEADEMLSMGFLEDVRAILSRLPDRRQGLFVSATISGRVNMLAGSFLTKPETMMIGKSTEDLPPVEHYYCNVGGDLMAKPTALCDLIETLRPGTAVIFCNTKSDTHLVEVLLRRRGFDARQINSDLTQNQRDRIMKKIRAGDLQFLVATDIAARGLDIDLIDLVINYSIHDQSELYIHRTGRTGRAGKSGKAISLVGPKDFGAFHYLTKVLNINFQKLPLPSDEDVADAQLAHLYEIIRQTHVELHERQLIAARKLLKEMGGITEPSEDLEVIVAKLCRFTLEHHLKAEIKSLDEELEARSEGEAGEQSHGRRERDRGGRDDRRGGRDRDRGHREDGERGRRGDRREGRGDDRRDRRDDRRDERGDDRRRNRRDEEGSEGYARRGEGERREDTRRDDDRRGNRRRDYERPRPAATEEPAVDAREAEGAPDSVADPEQMPPAPQTSQNTLARDTEVRLYIGQGLNQGMTAEVFSELAQELAELNSEDLRHLAIRENYGFVDVLAGSADILISSLNGIDYNGSLLPIELATVLNERRPRRNRDNRDYNNRREGGYDNRRDNRRGGGRRDNRGGRDRRDRGGYRR